MKDQRPFRWFIVMAACMALATTLNAQWGDLGNSGIVPPNQKVGGLTYAEWSARWWQFVYSIPAAQNPLLADSNYDCHVGQSGNVWFLTGIWGQPPIIRTRHCTMPAGKHLFFPVANNMYDNSIAGSDGSLDWTDYSTEYMRKALMQQMNTVVGMSCRIDGQPVHYLESVSTIYRVTSPVFHYWLPPENVFGISVPAPLGKLGIPGVVGDGVYLMVKPLSPGRHIIEFAASFGTAPGAYRFDITYVIDVVQN